MSFNYNKCIYVLFFVFQHNFYQQLLKIPTTSSKGKAEIINAMYTKKEGHIYIWKLLVEDNCTDNRVLQHYKIKDMEDALPNEQ